MRAPTKILLTLALALACAAGMGSRVVVAGPEPAVGLYWYSAVDPTAGGGVSAPMFQLLVRTDNGSIYYKSGSANTAWTLIGTSSGGITGSGTANTVPKWSGTTSLANSDITDDGTTVEVGGIKFQIAVATGNTIVGGTLNATAAATTLGNTSGANIFPTTLTVNTADWAPTGLATADAIFATASAPVQLSGLTGGTAGRHMNICSTGTNLSLTNEDTASVAANRFTLPNPQSFSNEQWTIDGGCLSMIYNGATSRWQVKNMTFLPNLDLGGNLNLAGNNISNVALVGASNVQTTTLGAAGTSTVAALAGTVIRPSVSGTLNNWNPTGLATATAIFAAPSALTTVTGLVAGVDGQYMAICNTSSTNDIKIRNQSSGSTAANQFILSAVEDWTLRSTATGGGPDCISFQYDASFAAWRAMTDLDLPFLVVDNGLNVGSGNVNAVTAGFSAGNGLFKDNGTPPVPTSCGSSPVQTGGALLGSITEGSGATGCVLTMSPAFADHMCNVTSRGGSPVVYALGTNTLTITGAVSGIIDFACH